MKKKIIIILILGSILSVCIGYGVAKLKLFSSNSYVIETLPSTQIIQTYDLKASYSDISRSPEIYKGKKLATKGTVLQVIEDGNKVSLRVAVGGNDDKVIFATYKTGSDYKRILENDTVTILGVSNGLYTYESALNEDITIPSVSVDYIILGNI